MKFKRILGLLLCVSLIISGMVQVPQVKTEAAETTENVSVKGSSSIATGGVIQQKSTAKLRLMYTTDIHGQVIDYDFQNNKSVTRGLNKVYTLMQEAREEVGQNYMTFDVGDSVKDYSTDYIHSQSETAIQPVYTAMSKIGYDAVTLGNHEFDYGYDYLINQLEGSGLIKLSVLSNVTSKVNGEHVLGAENKIIEKVVTDANGNSRKVKVGIFGVTPPSMSNRTESIKKNLASEDMLVVAEREVKALQKKGADIIIALAHTGYGVENPSKNAASTAYAMSKIDGIDVILAGHQHVYYPDDKEETFYQFPGTDKKTGLINGKRVMILKNQCRALGIVDLNLALDETGKATVTGSDYEIRKVKSTTKANSVITKTMDSWKDKLSKYSSQNIGTVKEGENWNSYSALLEDNSIMQTVLNAETQYASHYINNNATQYKDYPIIAAARYSKYGADSAEDYSEVSGKINRGKSSDFAETAGYICTYVMTGAQLREWMEWAASAYETVGTSSKNKYDDAVLQKYVDEEKGNSLIYQEDLVDWSKIFQFEGVDYTIDPSVEPRYDSKGNKINDTHRIKALTRNGKDVQDSDKFVLVCEQLLPSLVTEATNGIKENMIDKTYELVQDVVVNYIKETAEIGDLSIKPNYNWSLELPDGYKFMLYTGANAVDSLSKKSWYDKVYANLGGFNYISCVYNKEAAVQKPGINMVFSLKDKEEVKSTTLNIMATAKSGIKELKYVNSAVKADDPVWSTSVASGGAIVIDNNKIAIKDNGIYTVRAEDNNGNYAVDNIAVTNINNGKLSMPKVDNLTNKMKKITGTGDVGKTACVKIGSKTYTSKINVYKKFSISIPPQKAHTKLYVYERDSNGKTSSKRAVTVKRNGPNCPSVNTIVNNSVKVTGKTNDSNVKLFAVVDNRKVYVSKSLGSSYYKKCKDYNKSYSISKATIKINKNGSYQINLPVQKSGTDVRIYSIDKLGRVSCKRDTKVKWVAPEKVSVFKSYSGEKKVYGKVQEGESFKIQVVFGNGKKCYGVSDDYGYFAVSVPRMKKNAQITVYARKKNSSKKSYPAKQSVESVLKAYSKYNNTVVKSADINERARHISGKCKYRGIYVTAITSTDSYVAVVRGDGRYTISYNKAFRTGSSYYLLGRSKHGKIVGIRKKSVKVAAPYKPVIISKTFRGRKFVYVTNRKKYTTYLRVGKRRYKPTKIWYSRSKKRYVYYYRIAALKRHNMVIAYSVNSAGLVKSQKRHVR